MLLLHLIKQLLTDKDEIPIPPNHLNLFITSHFLQPNTIQVVWEVELIELNEFKERSS